MRGPDAGDRAARRISPRSRAVARRAVAPIDAHLKVDTGMGRLGVPIERAGELAVEAARRRHPRRRPDDALRVRRHRRSGAIPTSMTRVQLAPVRRGRSRGRPRPARRCASATRRTAAARCCFRRQGSIWCAPGSRSTATAGGRQARAARQQAMRLVTEVAQLRAVAGGRVGRLRRDLARRARRAGSRCCRSATPTACRAARPATRRSRSAASACRSSA